MKKVLFLILFTHTFVSLQAQENVPRKFRRKGIYGEAGLGEYVHVTLNAEHYFINKKYWHLGARIGFGPYSTWGGENGKEALLTLNGLLGKRYHFLELQAGGSFLHYKAMDDVMSNKETSIIDFYPFISAGYTLRYKHFLFKASAGSIGVVNVGLGVIL